MLNKTSQRKMYCLIVTLLLAFFPFDTNAAAGDLDATFGNGGKVTTEFHFAGATAVAVQADGKIVVAGTDAFSRFSQFALARYNTDGSLDNSFGNGGRVATSIGEFNDAYGLAIQQDGKIVVAGRASAFGLPIRDFAVVRYNSDGSLDTSFDGDGKVIVEMGDDNFANDLVIQPDGKIVVVGASGTSQSARDYAFAVARLNSDGSLDASFDGDGRVITSGFLSDYGATAVARQPDGKIIAAGQSGSGNSADFALVRYNADGSLDASFDGDGKVITAASNGYDRALDVALQPDGKIVAVGHSNEFSNIVVVRYAPNGSLDASFDGDGIAVTTVSQVNSASSVAIQSNDKIVVAGSIAGSSTLAFAIVRYNPTGSLDTSFGGDGIVTTEFDNIGNAIGYGHVNGLAIQPDGQIVAAGSWGLDGEFSVFALARYIGDAASPNSIDGPEFFVRQHYRDFLNREPDAEGLAFWSNEIISCGGDPACTDHKRVNVSAAYFLSIESQETGYLVYRSYKAAFDNLPNTPVPLKFDEFRPDTQQIGQGVIVNQIGWEQLLENNKQNFFFEFVQRSRFASLYPTSLTPAQFVNQLFTNAGVTPSTIDRETAINEFGGMPNTADLAARARALRRVAENQTLAQQEFNRAFVLMQYFGYLRRNPNDPPEAALNFDGYDFWLNKLNQFNGDYVQAEMVKSFLLSTEYRRRFEP